MPSMYDDQIRELAKKRAEALQPRQQKPEEESNILGTIGGIAGAIIGGVTAGPAGAIEGYGAGRTIGGIGDSLISSKKAPDAKDLKSAYDTYNKYK